MYNSIVVSILMKIWHKIEDAYKESYFKRMIDKIREFFIFLSKGSRMAEIIKSDSNLLGKSYFYKIYSYIVDFINKLVYKINKKIKSDGNGSFVYKNTRELFKDNYRALETLFVFMFFFGIGILANNIVRSLSGRSYILSFIIIFVSSIGILLSDKYFEILNNSNLYIFIKNIFDIEEEGESWW